MLLLSFLLLAPGFRLDYAAPTGSCPAAGALRARVTASLDQSPFDDAADAVLRVRVTREAAAFVARVGLGDGRARTLRSPDCAALLDAVSVAIALVVDPLYVPPAPVAAAATTDPPSAPAAPVSVAPPSAPPSVPPAASPTAPPAVPVSAPPSAPPAVPPSAPASTAPPSAPPSVPPTAPVTAAPVAASVTPRAVAPLGWSLWAGSTLDTGAAPAARLGLVARVAARRGAWSMGLGGRFEPTRVGDVTGGGASVGGVGAAVDVARHVGPFALGALVQGGWQTAEGAGFGENDTVAGPYLAAGVRGSAGLVLGDHLEARAHLDATAPITRLRLRAGANLAWETAAIVLGGGLQLGWRWDP